MLQDFASGLMNHLNAVRKKTKCSGETEILQELVHETTQKSESHELICIVA